MWIATVNDNETEELYELLVLDHEELTDLLDFVKMNPNLELHHLEERWLIGDVDSFKKLITGDDNG